VARVALANAEANGIALQAQAREWASVLETALVQASTRRTSERARFVTDVRASVDTAFARLLEAAISTVPRALAALLAVALLQRGRLWFRRQFWRRVRPPAAGVANRVQL